MEWTSHLNRLIRDPYVTARAGPTGDYRAKNHKCDDGLNGLCKKVDLTGRCRRRILGLRQLQSSHRGYEDRSNAHRSKMTTEHRLTERLDIRDPFVQSHDGRETSEKKDKDSHDDKPPHGEVNFCVRK